MEAPFIATTWDGVTGAIYTGYGSAEWLWVGISMVCIAVAVVAGWRHEDHAYDTAKTKL